MLLTILGLYGLVWAVWTDKNLKPPAKLMPTKTKNPCNEVLGWALIMKQNLEFGMVWANRAVYIT